MEEGRNEGKESRGVEEGWNEAGSRMLFSLKGCQYRAAWGV